MIGIANVAFRLTPRERMASGAIRGVFSVPRT
jgi:hypothetical protein